MKKHSKLITIDIDHGEVYLSLHEDLTVQEALDDVATNGNLVCFAMTPAIAIQLAKDLIDAAYTGSLNEPVKVKLPV